MCPSHPPEVTVTQLLSPAGSFALRPDLVHGAGRGARSARSLQSIAPRFRESTTERQLPAHRPRVGGAGARHNGRPRSPHGPRLILPPFQRVPLPRHRQPGVALGATRRNASGQRGVPEPGMWGARPLAELSCLGRPAAEPASRPSFGAPIGRSRPTRARSRPQPAQMETGLRGWEAEAGRGGRSILPVRGRERQDRPIRTRRGKEAPRQPVTSRGPGRGG